MAQGTAAIGGSATKKKVRLVEITYTANATPDDPDVINLADAFDGLFHMVRVVESGVTTPTGGTTYGITDRTGRTPFGAAFTAATATEKRAISDSDKAALPNVGGLTLTVTNNAVASAAATIYIWIQEL